MSPFHTMPVFAPHARFSHLRWLLLFIFYLFNFNVPFIFPLSSLIFHIFSLPLVPAFKIFPRGWWMFHYTVQPLKLLKSDNDRNMQKKSIKWPKALAQRRKSSLYLFLLDPSSCLYLFLLDPSKAFD